ncbi:MAG: chromosome partitioning protein ParB [Verrucomicrobia bacterium]|nr:MAG: chromosome partitioning protein ParB [Verrucomicrobiota bacterium]
MTKPALGRGLGALLGATAANLKPPPSTTSTVTTPAPGPALDSRERVHRIPVDRIRPSPFQPRKDFTPEALRELADSIKEQGIIQPLIVRERQDHYELIAGERRWRAAQLLALKEVPAIVRDADDHSVLELALIENLQRENLNPLEEALGYSQLIEQFHLRQEDVAAKVGKSRVAVTNALRLLKLPPEVQDDLRDSRISVGHAKVILGLASAADQKLVAKRINKEGLSVRQTEKLVAHLETRRQTTGAPSSPGIVADPRDANIVGLENQLREKFGTRVQLHYQQGKGFLEIKFFNDDDLDRILQIVGIRMD